MGRVARWLVWLMVVLVSLAAAGVAAFLVKFPADIPVRTLKVERTEARLERGSYLAEHVAVCTDCHSERDFARFSGPVKSGTVGMGGAHFGKDLGLPGDVVARNITPYKLSSWSDGEILRALTSGVSRDGSALFPLMPYQNYANMCEEDLLSVISFVRSLKPVKNEPEASTLDFPLNLLVRTLPKAATLVKSCPKPDDGLAYGKYLVTMASCADCHTPRNGPDVIPGSEFAGGTTIPLPNGGTVTSANLTPDVETGIGSWSKEAFIARFRNYRDAASLHAVGRNERQTIMPWSQYAGMSDQDLGAIYDFLRTQKPVRSDAKKPVASL
jgi:hypothetical protein